MTKERLRRYKAIKTEIRQIEDRLAEVEGSLYDPKGQQLTGMPFPPSRIGSGSAQEQLADKTMELRSRYREKLQELAAEQLAIEAAIESLEPTQRMLLRHRYIEGLTWEEVCVKMSYSWMQVHRIHSNALQRLQAAEG